MDRLGALCSAALAFGLRQWVRRWGLRWDDVDQCHQRQRLLVLGTPIAALEAGAWTLVVSYSVAVDFDDRVGEGLWRLLGKVVPNPTADHAVAVPARELVGVCPRF